MQATVPKCCKILNEFLGDHLLELPFSTRAIFYFCRITFLGLLSLQQYTLITSLLYLSIFYFEKLPSLNCFKCYNCKILESFQKTFPTSLTSISRMSSTFFAQSVLVLLLAITVIHEKVLQFLLDLSMESFPMKTFLSHLWVYNDKIQQKSCEIRTTHSPQLHKHKIDMIYF